VSDVTGFQSWDASSSYTADPVKEKRAALLTQTIFSDSQRRDSQLDLERHCVEASRQELVQESPRSAYIMGCLGDNLNPRGSHIVRKTISDELHLEHFGMGDDLIEHLATSLQFLPHVTYINIADNNLTDWGLVNVLNTIVNVKNLLILDMSHNKIGTDCADALASYLRGNPALQRLILQKTDIDDFEGEMFVKAIHNCTNLIELNLSMNELGNQEILNSVRPNTTTAPEELGSLLTELYCPIKTLNLAWNVIRLDSAAALAKSLAVNESLTYLDLSYNCIGPDGGRIVGESLFDNHSLQTLLLANNSIDATSCFVICAAIQLNYSLTHLCMDGNPIGEIGAKSLMNIPASLGSRLTLTADKCNVNLRSLDHNWFDEEDPCGTYHLDMTDSFSRAVAFKILTIAANHYSYDIKKCTFTEKEESREKMPIHLHQRISREKLKYMTEKENKILGNLHRLMDSADDMQCLKNLFVEYDFNQSGTLEHFELKVLLDDLGMKLADNQLENAMTFIDTDKSGSIDLDAFVGFMVQYREDVEARIRDMTEGVVMSQYFPEAENDDDLIDPANGDYARYIPPTSGFLHIELTDTYVKKSKFNIITEVDCNNIIDIATRIGHVSKMISYALHSAKLRFNEALTLFDVMFHDIGNKAEVLLILLPHMLLPMEARILVSRVTNEDPVEVEFVRQKLGNALPPIFGLPCGYYSMDLSKPIDRICLVKLFECGIGTMERRKLKDPLNLGWMGDTSQSRNWSAFRNEVYKGQLFKVVPEKLTPIPREGLLEFDFVVHERPPSGTQVMTDEKLTQILINTSLVNICDKDYNLKLLHQSTTLTKSCLGANGKLLYVCDKTVAAEIGSAQSDFYYNIYDRSEYHQEGIKREAIKSDFKALRKRSALLTRLVSMTNEDNIMHLDSEDSYLSGAGNDPTVDELSKAESFDEKFKDFISRPLGEQQIKLLEKHLANTIEEKQFTPQDDISEICYSKITRSEIYVRRNMLTKPLTTDSGPEPEPEPEPEEQPILSPKKKSKRGEMITLPSIVVMKNDKPFTLPSITFPREEEKEDSAMDEFMIKTDTTVDESDKQITRAIMMSSANNLLANTSMSEEYNDHQKRLNLQTRNRRRMRNIADSKHVTIQAKASKLLVMMLDFVGIYYIRSRHVANLIHNFPQGREVKTEFCGTYRVELVIALFSKIVDIHNFDLIFKILEPFEQACLYCRLGWLNLFCPTRPERSYELNMEIWEERMVAKALLYLADIEEGENVGDADFRWSRDMDRMPGWLVTKPWMSENTMQRKGLLTLTYISSARDYRLVPDVSARKSLLHMVLANEELMVPEGGVQSPPKGRAIDFKANPKSAQLEGVARMHDDAEKWAAYFYGDKNVNSKITNVTKKK